jgi:solute carrier family 35 protein E3
MTSTTREEDIEMSKTGLLAEEFPDETQDKRDGFTKAPVKTLQSKIVDGLCIVLNIASTVILVFLNNWYHLLQAPTLDRFILTLSFRILKDEELKKCQISFAMWHFTCTSIVLYLATRRPFSLFVPIRLPFLQMIPLCAFFAGFLVLGNLSLAYNSIGFYQYVST